jgi:hypothetical protein
MCFSCLQLMNVNTSLCFQLLCLCHRNVGSFPLLLIFSPLQRLLHALANFFINELMFSCKLVVKFAIARELVCIYKFMPTCELTLVCKLGPTHELVQKFDALVNLQLPAMQFINTFFNTRTFLWWIIGHNLLHSSCLQYRFVNIICNNISSRWTSRRASLQKKLLLYNNTLSWSLQ